MKTMFDSLSYLICEAGSSNENLLIAVKFFLVAVIVQAILTFVFVKVEDKVEYTRWGNVVILPLSMLGFVSFILTIFSLIIAVGAIITRLFS